MIEDVEFALLETEESDLSLPDEIKRVKGVEELEGKQVIIGNSRDLNPVIYAPEVNFYLRHSPDDPQKKAKGVLTLYKLRHLKYSYSTDIPQYQPVQNRLLIIGSPDRVEEFLKDFNDKEAFEISQIEPDKLTSIKGSIGSLVVTFKDENDHENRIETDQVIFFNVPENHERVGVYDPAKLGFEQTYRSIVKNLKEGYEYTKIIRYDPSICQYHERKHDVCGFCADFCPVEAILKIDDKRHLEFVEVNCTGCGGCISICPSGALDYAETSRGVFHMMSKAFRDRIALIIPEEMNIDSLDVRLKEDVLPFVIGGRKFLDESHFLTILQESGSQVILYNDSVSRGTREAIEMVNEFYRRAYNEEAILLAEDHQQLQTAIDNAKKLEGTRFTIANQMYAKKREIVANRLSHLVGNRDLGVYKTGEFIHYCKIKIDTNKCTLCLSCAGGCNLEALKPNSSDNTLRFTPIICSSCGYCELICPEECLELIDDTLELKPEYFTEQVLAKDELFRCIECGKPFAPARSIRKIAEMMIPIFGEDDPRVKTLYCCPDCKPKVMLKHQIEQEMKGKKGV